MSDIARHPLLARQHIDGVLTYFPIAVQRTPFAQFMPLVSLPHYNIKMDVEKAMKGGMTPAVSVGSPSPIYGTFGRGFREFESAEFREKVILHEQELHNFRTIGTLDGQDSAVQMLNRKFRAIEERLVRRLEWMRRQVLFDGAVTAPVDGIETTLLNVARPDYTQFVAGTPWSNVAATPLDDMQLWKEEYELYSGFMLDQIMLPQGTLRQLTKNDLFRDIAVNSHGSFRGSGESVRAILADYIGLSAITENKSRFDFTSELLADASATDTTITVRKTSTTIAAGDVLTIKNPQTWASENVVVDAPPVVNGDRVTITLAAPGLVGDHVAGTPLKWFRRSIPLDQILMIGRVDTPLNTENSEGGVDMENLNAPMNISTTLSHYSDLMGAPRTGMFRRTIDRTDGDPPHIEQVLGIRCLPVIKYSEAWATAQIA